MNRKQTIRCLSLLVLAAVLMGGGCATPRGSLHLASRYLQSGEYDKAAELLQQELKQHPNRPEIRTLLFRAKLNSYYYHLGLARERRQAEDRAAAGKEYRIALAIFPDNRHLQQELEEYLGGRPPEEKAAKSFVQPPVTLGVDKVSKIDLKLSNIPMTNIFKSLGKSFGVNFIFDKEFRDFLHSVEIENKTFGEILRMLCLVANSQYRVLDHNTVLVYPDQFNKKQQFDLRGIKTFYLSNIKAEDAKKLLMSIFVAAGQQVMIQEESNLNALIIRADYNTLAEIEKFLPNIDLERNETAIDVEILEVNRSLINQLGVDFSNAVFTVGAGLEAPDSKNPAPIRFGDLRNVNFYLTIPSVALSFLETDENNKLIAKPNLRGLDGEEISFMVGDEIPIPETVYAGYAAGGVSTVPVTTYRYRNVGVEIKMKPFVHQNNEVTLKIKLTISFVTSTGVATSFPTLGKREIEAILRLKEGETNIIGGFIRDDVRSSLSGLPALARLPILGQLFGNTQKNIQQTDLIFSITPHVIRRTPVKDKNLEAIWANVEQNEALPGSAETEARLPQESAPERPAGNAVTVSPAQVRIPAGSEAVFSVSLQSASPITTLTLRGVVAEAGAEIVEAKTDFFNESVKIFKSLSGGAMDAGYTFSDPASPLLHSPLMQLKIKFANRGAYTLRIENINAYDAKRNRVEIAPATARIDVY